MRNPLKNMSNRGVAILAVWLMSTSVVLSALVLANYTNDVLSGRHVNTAATEQAVTSPDTPTAAVSTASNPDTTSATTTARKIAATTTPAAPKPSPAAPETTASTPADPPTICGYVQPPTTAADGTVSGGGTVMHYTPAPGAPCPATYPGGN